MSIERTLTLSELVRYAGRNAKPPVSTPAVRCLPDHEVSPARAFVWYLATPYTALTPDVVGERAHLATRMAGQLVGGGLNVYSPIASHHAASSFMPADQVPDHAGWMQICYGMLDRCDGLIVSTMEGWYESKGVRREIERWIAMKSPKHVLYVSPIYTHRPWTPVFSWQAWAAEAR